MERGAIVEGGDVGVGGIGGGDVGFGDVFGVFGDFFIDDVDVDGGGLVVFLFEFVGFETSAAFGATASAFAA